MFRKFWLEIVAGVSMLACIGGCGNDNSVSLDDGPSQSTLHATREVAQIASHGLTVRIVESDSTHATAGSSGRREYFASAIIRAPFGVRYSYDGPVNVAVNGRNYAIRLNLVMPGDAFKVELGSSTAPVVVNDIRLAIDTCFQFTGSLIGDFDYLSTKGSPWAVFSKRGLRETESPWSGSSLPLGRWQTESGDSYYALLREYVADGERRPIIYRFADSIVAVPGLTLDGKTMPVIIEYTYRSKIVVNDVAPAVFYPRFLVNIALKSYKGGRVVQGDTTSVTGNLGFDQGGIGLGQRVGVLTYRRERFAPPSGWNSSNSLFSHVVAIGVDPGTSATPLPVEVFMNIHHVAKAP